LDVPEAYSVSTAFLVLQRPNNGFVLVKRSDVCTAYGFCSAFFCVVALEVQLAGYKTPVM